MATFLDNKFNPNPITKIFVVGLFGLTVVHPINNYFEWAMILFLSLIYLINGFKKDAIKNIITFGILFMFPNITALSKMPVVIKMFLTLFLIVRMFYLPFAAGKLLIKTSDVGSIISSMDKLKIPSAFSIPIAVMFRFFPSFKEERKNIKLAMKIRGIHTGNPIKYLEYVAVPLLIVSSNIADDTAKAAETKCIENPIKKNRYIKIGIKSIDFIYASLSVIFAIGGWLCLK